MRRIASLLRPLRLLSAITLAGALVFSASLALAADQPTMGTAGNYAVMAASTITNTGPTVVNGNLAISPGSSVTGFPPGDVTGASDEANANAVTAHTDLVAAYNDAAGETPTRNLTGTDLGGLTLTPGTYRFDSSAQLTGILTLDGQGDTNATFIFQIGSTLTTASASTVELVNGAGSCAVFWQVASSATLGTTTDFQGTIMAMVSITMNTGATIGVGGLGNGGRALAMTGALTLDSNTITPPPAGCAFAAAATPTPVATPVATPVETPVATPVPTPVATAAPTAAETSLPTTGESAAPGATTPAGTIPSPTPGSSAGETGPELTGVPTFDVPGLSLIPGLPNTSLSSAAAPIAGGALLAMVAAAILVWLSGMLVAGRRRA